MPTLSERFRRPHVGLPADELLKMAGRSIAHLTVWPSKVTGQDEEGLLIDCEYADIVVEMHYRQGRYRVRAVREKEVG